VPGFSTWDSQEVRIERNLERILGHCEANGIFATFFCLGWLAEKHPKLIKKIDAYGHEVASHSYAHQLVYSQDKLGFRKDLERSIGILEDITGKKVVGYRAPGFSITEKVTWAFEILKDCGIEYDSSVFTVPRAHGGMPKGTPDQPFLIKTKNGSLKEFPISGTAFFGQDVVYSGGGYFRLFPFKLIKHFIKQSKCTMFYFHPRDFDPDQPVLDLPFLRKFKSYVGLKSAEKKFSKLLESAEFVDIKTAASNINWSSSPEFIPDSI